MVVLEEYLEFFESRAVSSLWKGLQIAIYVCIALVSVVSSFTFGHIFFYIFENNCFLYSNVTFQTGPPLKFLGLNHEFINTSISSLPIGQVDNIKTNWGNSKHCNYCLFSLVCSFIFSFLWATFFTMCGKGGIATRGLSAPWKIVLPAFIFNTTYFVVTLVAAIELENGYSIFCLNFMKNMNKDDCTTTIQKMSSTSAYPLPLFVQLSRMFIWFAVALWCCSVVLLTFRVLCITDFDLYRVQFYMKDSNETIVDDEPIIEKVTAVVHDVNSPSGREV